MMFDTALYNAWIIDPGSGEMFEGTLGICQGKIAAIERGRMPVQAKEQMDLEGMCVCPGFIDVHGHIDGNACVAERSLRQGITTTVGGNCGLSPVDMQAFFEAQDAGFLIHQAEMIGHTFSLRQAVGLTDPYQPANPEQIRAMERMAEEALEAGACGISFGLDYAPGTGMEEIDALTRVAVRHDRIVPIHTRMFTGTDMYSLCEALHIARQGAHVQLSHLVYQYPEPCLMEEALQLIDYARAHDLNVSVDSGMYTAFAAPLGTATFDEQTIDIAGWNFSDMLVTTGDFRGHKLNPDLYHHLRRCEPEASVVCFCGKLDAVFMALQCGYVMPSTDAGCFSRPGEGHPQAAATFPKFLRKCVRERGLLSLPEAVRRATLLPAQTMNLAHKGRMEVGADADLVVFDAERIEDRAGFVTPDLPPVGLPHVFVAGQLALRDGELTGVRAGRALRFA